MTEASDVLFFYFNGNRLAFRKFGHGPATVVAFHGFGQDGHIFWPVSQTAGHRFTVLAIDLFFHGDSRYESSQLLTKTEWQSLLYAFLDTQGVNRFSVMSFSLGGRFALTAIEAFADRLDQVMLIAPDGVTRSGWYQLATTTKAGRRLFRYGLRHLSALSHVGHALVRVGLLNRTVMRFAELSLGTPAQRTLVYEVWTKFRLITPTIGEVSSVLNQYPVRVRLFTGAFDRIVPGSYLLPLTRQLQHYELTVLKTGHNHLVQMVADELAD